MSIHAGADSDWVDVGIGSSASMSTLAVTGTGSTVFNSCIFSICSGFEATVASDGFKPKWNWTFQEHDCSYI